MPNTSNLDLFRVPVNRVIEQRIEQATRATDSESDAYIRGVDQQEFLGHVYSIFAFDIPVVDFSNRLGETVEYQIPATAFRGLVMPGTRALPRSVIRVCLPCEGDASLLSASPSTHTNFTTHIVTDERGIWLEYPVLDPASESAIQSQVTSDIGRFELEYQRLKAELENGNQRLANRINQHLALRRQRLDQGDRLLETMGILVRRTPDAAPYAAPAVEKMLVLPRPEPKAPEPEPILLEDVYEEILGITHSLGKAFERYPATYHHIDEESLRDHFLLHLEPRFSLAGSATGETFNKEGKTDILIRFHGVTVFVAECKWWAGEKEYLDALTQLLGYVTWRDSKTAILLFVRNQAIAPVLKTIAAATPGHSNFVQAAGGPSDGWFHYIFHLNGDPNRQLKVAVQVFHFPPPTKGEVREQALASSI